VLSKRKSVSVVLNSQRSNPFGKLFGNLGVHLPHLRVGIFALHPSHTPSKLLSVSGPKRTAYVVRRRSPLPLASSRHRAHHPMVANPSRDDEDDQAARKDSNQRLYLHVATRGFELGAYGGIIIGLPMLLRKRRASLESTVSPLLTAALRKIGNAAIYTSAATGELRTG